MPSVPSLKKIISQFGFYIVKAGVLAPNSVDRFQELSTLRYMLKSLEIDCVVDVGANIGQFGRDLRRIGYDGWIYSFEPSGNAYGLLLKALDSKWIAERSALGASEGSLEMHIESYSVMNSFRRPIDRPVLGRETVAVGTLSNVIDKIKSATGAKNIFLKIDTQGFDMEVLKGAGTRVTEFRGLLSEVSVRPLYEDIPSYIQALECYGRAGFVLHSLYPVSRDKQRSVIEYN